MGAGKVRGFCFVPEWDGTLTVGSDPEFEVHHHYGDSESIIENASRISDECGFQFYGKIGRDDAGQQLELRPTESYTPQGAVDNLTEIFRMFCEETPPCYNLSVKGDNYAVGGHLHLGVGRPVSYNWLTYDYKRLLDFFLRKPFKDLNGFARGNYNINSFHSRAFEQKPWGFEYRCLPAAVFHNPIIYKIVSTLFLAITYKYLKGEEILLGMSRRNFGRLGLSVQDYENLFMFIDNYKAGRLETKQIVSFWVRGERPKKTELSPKGKLYFRDDWSSCNIAHMYGSFSRESENFLLSVDRETWLHQIENSSVNVVLFGLKSDRGKKVVSGIEVEGFETITDDNFPEVERHSNTIYIGLPWVFRQEHFTADGRSSLPVRHTMDAKLIEAIGNVIKNLPKRTEV